MRKVLTFVAAVCCMMLGFVSTVNATELADKAVIKVGGTDVTDENKDDILSDGKVSYDPTSHTLSFADGASIKSGGVSIQAKGTYGVKINVTGGVSIQATNVAPLHYIGFNSGYPLSIEGDASAILSIMQNGDGPALLCATDASTTVGDNMYPLKISGGMRVNLNNYMNSSSAATVICHHMSLNAVTVSFTAYIGKDVERVYAADDYSKTMPCWYSDNEVTFYKFEQSYPVMVNGFQLCDGKTELSSIDMPEIKSGGVKYDAETRTLYLNSGFELEPKMGDGIDVIADGKGAVTIHGATVGVFPAKITAPDGAHAIYAAGPAILDLGSANMTLKSTTWATVVFDDELTIKSSGGFLTVEAKTNMGLAGQDPKSKLTLDHCAASITAKDCAIRDCAFEMKGVAFVDADFSWDADNKYIKYAGSEAKNATIEFELSEWKFSAKAIPEEAGSVAITGKENPYYFSATEDIEITATPTDASWEFYRWSDLYDVSDPENTNPRTFTLYKGMDSEKNAMFTRKASTSDNYLAVYNSDQKVYAYEAGLKGTNTTPVATIPVTSGWNIDNSTYGEGKLFWVEYDGMGNSAIQSAEFDGTTIGTQENVIGSQDKYSSWRGFAYNEEDGKIYAVAYDNTLYSNWLLEINLLSGVLSEIAEVPMDVSYLASMTFGGGNLYAVAGTGPCSLYTINIANAAATKVGDFPSELSMMDYSSTALVYDGTGEMYLSANAPTMMYMVNPTTAKAYLVAENMMQTNSMFTTAPPKPKHKITIKVADGQETMGKTDPSGDKMLPEDAKLTIKAIANPHYEFDKWSDSGEKDHEITVGTADAVYTAYFKPIEGETVYPILMGATEFFTGNVTYVGPKDELKAGAVMYDDATKTLTLNAANIQTSGALAGLRIGNSSAKGQELTIIIIGDCKISSIAEAILLEGYKKVTIKGQGTGAKLTLNSNGDALKMNNVDLTIQGLEMDVVGSNGGIVGVEKMETLEVIGAKLSAMSAGGSIKDIAALVTQYCDLPSGYEFDEDKNYVKKSGSMATDKVQFSTYPKLSAVGVQEGTGTFTLRSDDDTFEDVGWFKNGTKVTITANANSGFSFIRWMDDSKWKDEENRMVEEREITMGSSDKEYTALFFANPKSSATWYAVSAKDNKFVSFELDDYGKEVAKATNSASSVHAGDFVSDAWWYLTGTTIKSLPFSDITDGEKIEGDEEKIANAVATITDMAYDLMGGDMYAVSGTDLYKVNVEDQKTEKLGTFKDKDKNTIGVVGIAIDGGSTAYVLASGTEGALYTFGSSDIDEDKNEVLLTAVGDEDKGGKIGMEVKAGDKQSIAFDHVTGELFWGASDYMRIIDMSEMKAFACADVGQTGGAQGYLKSLHRMDKTVRVTVEVADKQDAMGTVQIGTSTKASANVIVGTKVKLTAVPKEGYHFVKWMIKDKDEEAGTTATLEVTVKKKITYVAYFAEGEGIENVSVEGAPRKIMHEGTLYIIRDGKVYNANGIRVK